MTIVDARNWNRTDMWRLPSLEPCVRPGLRRIYTPDSGRLLVGGFSVQNEFTEETWHYVFDVSSTVGANADLRLQILTEDFQVFQIFSMNTNVVPRVVTHAVVQGQIIISSPDFATVWGLVGSSVRFAVKQPSVNPSTTAIDVPNGVCTAWCNRVVIANGNSLFISDPIASTGGDARTYVAENQNQRPGVIFGVHEGANGMLVVVTSSGTYGLDSGAAAVQIVGSNGTDWRILNHTHASSFASSCVVRGRVYALTQDGWCPVDQESDVEQVLTDPVMPRALGTRVSIDDYRTCRLYSGELGPITAADLVFGWHMMDIPHTVLSWWHDPASRTNFYLRGVLREPDGTLIFLTMIGIFRSAGNFDGEIALTSGNATQPRGGFFGVVPGTPGMNQTVRHVSVSAEVGGAGSIYAALRGKNYGGKVPLADGEGITIGVDSWGTATKRYTTTPLTDVQFDYGTFASTAQRDVGLEASADGALTRILPILDVEMSESAPRRPTAKG